MAKKSGKRGARKSAGKSRSSSGGRKSSAKSRSSKSPKRRSAARKGAMTKRVKKVAAAGRRMIKQARRASKNAPAGSESVVALVKSALSGATGAYEGLQKSAKQMTDVAAANFTAMSDTAVKATQAASKPKRVA